MSIKLLLVFLILKPNSISSAVAVGDCYEEITNDLIKEFQPVYIDPINDIFFQPKLINTGNYQEVIIVKENEKLRLWCSEGWENLNGAPNLITVTCKGGYLDYDGSRQKINLYKCKNWSKLMYKRTETNCFGTASFVDVGYQISDTFWLNIYTVCFDPISEKTHYSNYNIWPTSSQGGIDEPNWEQTDFFSSPNRVYDLYKNAKQSETISAIFNVANAGVHFIQGNKFMSRGHLAAKNDFVYATQQRSTYHFINIAPQWQTINGGNWKKVESWSKNAANVRKGLEVYTGTFGILELKYNSVDNKIVLDYSPDSNVQNNGFFQKLITFFSLSSNSRSSKIEKIPAPKLIYKILIDNKGRIKNGVVFISSNNPFKDQKQMECKEICPNQNDNMKFKGDLKKNLDNIDLGIICTCLVQDFLKSVPNKNLVGKEYELMVLK